MWSTERRYLTYSPVNIKNDMSLTKSEEKLECKSHIVM